MTLPVGEPENDLRAPPLDGSFKVIPPNVWGIRQVTVPVIGDP